MDATPVGRHVYTGKYTAPSWYVKFHSSSPVMSDAVPMLSKIGLTFEGQGVESLRISAPAHGRSVTFYVLYL